MSKFSKDIDEKVIIDFKLKKIDSRKLMLDFSKRLNFLCKETNSTIRKISEITRTNYSLLKAVSLGFEEPNFDILYYCSCFFNVSADYLLGLIKNYNLENLSVFEPDPDYISASIDGTEFTDIFCYPYDSLAKNLRSIINELNLTELQIANLFQISIQEVSNWENPNIFLAPSITQLIQLADFCKLSVDELLGLNELLELDDFGARTGTTAAPMGESITAEERELLRYFRELSPYLKGMTMEAVKSWAKKNNDDEQKKA